MKTISNDVLTFNEREIAKRDFDMLSAENSLARDVAVPLFDAGVRLAGMTQRLDYTDKLDKPGARAYHSIVLMLQGTMRLEVDGEVHHVCPGDLSCCPAGVPYRRSARDGASWWLMFQIDDTPAWEAIKANGAYVRHYESAALMVLLLRQVLDAKLFPKQTDIVYTQSCSRQLFNLLRHEMVLRGKKQSKHAASLQELVNMIERAPERPWERNDMAGVLHMSVRQLTQVFREELGISPRQLVVRLRMNRAIEQIVNSQRPIKRIAAEVGYHSLHSFTRLFTKYVGVSPGSYRDRFSNLDDLPQHS